MKWNKGLLAFIFCIALAGSAAETVGAPQNSQPVRDLRATRKGDKVILTWSQPRETADKQSAARRLEVARVCRDISAAAPSPAPASDPAACTQTVGQVDLQKSTAISGKSNAPTVQFIDTLPKEQKNSDPLQFAVYRVELRDDHGHRAGLSNPALVLLTPMPEIEELHFQLDVRGVFLIWQEEIDNRPPSVQFDYRIYRREKNSSHRVAVPYLRGVTHTREGDRWSGVDTNIEWEKSYLYWVTPIAKVYAENGTLISEIEGEDSAPIAVTTHDVFPPAVPEGLLATASQIPGKKFVDLMWAPNGEKDLAGYNVYRREEGGQMVRIHSVPPAMLSFQDLGVVAGRRYFYAVSAIDAHGNESAKSPESLVVQP